MTNQIQSFAHLLNTPPEVIDDHIKSVQESDLSADVKKELLKSILLVKSVAEALRENKLTQKKLKRILSGEEFTSK